MAPSRIDVDVAVLIALKEEFEWFREILAGPVSTIEEESNYFYIMDCPVDGAPPYKLVLALCGTMGITAAAMATSILLQNFAPRVIVNIGIAGGLKDVRFGDVVVPDQVVAYLENSKAVAAGADKFEFRLAAEVYRCAFSLVKLMQNFSIAYEPLHAAWKRDCKKDLLEIFNPREISDFEAADNKLAAERQRGARFRTEPVIKVGHTASGPAVAAAEVFAEWLKKHSDRSFLCVEMEAAGMLAATASAMQHVDSLVIRSVSDFSDEEKSVTERAFGDRFRRYAMRNATRLFACLLQAGLLPRRPTRGEPPRQTDAAPRYTEISTETSRVEERLGWFPSPNPEIKDAPVNPHYDADLQTLKSRGYDLNKFFDKGTVVVAVGREWPQDVWDRPVAAWVRDTVEMYLSLYRSELRSRSVVISDSAADSIVGNIGGLISIGGPAVNRTTLRIASGGHVREISKGVSMCFLKERIPQVALWGDEAFGTRSAAHHYIHHQEGLAEFVRICQADDSGTKIESPRSGEIVGASVRVEGRMSNPPAGVFFWLATVPGDGNLHPQGEPIRVEGGRWEGVAYLGRQGLESLRETFTIKLVAVSRAVSDHLTAYLRSALSTDSYPGVGGIPHRIMAASSVTRRE